MSLHFHKLPRIALAVNLCGVWACAGEPRPAPGLPIAQADLPGPFASLSDKAFRLPPHRGYVDRRKAGRARDEAPAARGFAADEMYVLDQLTSSVADARFDDSLGDAMDDALATAEADGRPVDAYGTGALDYYELFGDDIHAGACELPRVVSTVEHEGTTWEMTLGMAALENFVGDPVMAMGELPSECGDSLLAGAGDIDAATDCSSVDEAMFFPEGSDCRTCLEENGGDIDACQSESRCLVEAPVLESKSGTYWNRFEATLLACAPDRTVPAYVLAHANASGEPPSPFDYDNWGYICAPFWDDYSDSVTYLCHGGADTLRVGVVGLVEGMRRDGDDTPWYRHSSYYTPRISLVDGVELRYAWEAYTSLGILSAPVTPPDTNGDGEVDAGDDYFGYQYISWGLNPFQTRPDGADPEVLDDTFARDWLAAIAMKTATTADGISILMANHSRCAEDAWEDADGDGVYRCVRTENPTEGWLGDLPHFRWDPDVGTTYPMPVVTLGSTGLPDPTIPGGIVPWVAGSPTLGDPDWDNCTWNNAFEPDRAPLPDTPLDYTGAGSIQGDTWRFGGHSDADIRLILYTNTARNYCPDSVVP